ncbi:hypothetical protein [Spirosoma aerolatum]|uniref:hypothetical protein n=1 Tax=Spirosoma aerolatum TaxID=1211326 RepID=UPI0009AC52B3|nr:hypothetical protein [Spirosoma aerolatum]
MEFIKQKVHQIFANQVFLSDTIRMALYQEDPNLFGLLDYDNDSIFLEPTLFCHFLSDIDKNLTIPLSQSLLGYISVTERPKFVSIKADQFGIINLPNLGYIRVNSKETTLLMIEQLEQNLIRNQFLPNSIIRLCWHPTDLLRYEKNITFYEPVESTAQKYQHPLFQAVIFFQRNLPDFWQLIESVTREFVVFNSPPEQHSFAGIMHHGTAYFNVENKPQTPIFFIDDIAHQCGHIIFNALTLDTGKYLRVPKDFPLKEFTGVSYERRGVYGAFHGLFTYTTILHSLDTVLSNDSISDIPLRYEALGRLGFYINKFGLDLTNMNNPKILTDEGMEFHRQFAAGYAYICQKYQPVLKGLDYHNQPYTFQYDLFSTLNPIRNTNFV